MRQKKKKIRKQCKIKKAIQLLNPQSLLHWAKYVRESVKIQIKNYWNREMVWWPDKPEFIFQQTSSLPASSTLPSRIVSSSRYATSCPWCFQQTSSLPASFILPSRIVSSSRYATYCPLKLSSPNGKRMGKYQRDKLIEKQVIHKNYATVLRIIIVRYSQPTWCLFYELSTP